MAGIAILGSSVIGGISSIFGASKASKAQQNAAAMAQQTALDMYNRTRADLAPYRDAGGRALTTLEERLPELTSDIDVSAELRDPNSTIKKAYDFTRTQGLKSVQNSAAARGLGVSGAALKGASQFATGLADNTYQNLFNMENINRTNAYSRLKGLVDTGQNAAAGTGKVGTDAANTAASAQMASGDTEAAMWNAAGSAVRNAANNVGGYYAYQGLYGTKDADDQYRAAFPIPYKDS